MKWSTLNFILWVLGVMLLKVIEVNRLWLPRYIMLSIIFLLSCYRNFPVIEPDVILEFSRIIPPTVEELNYYQNPCNPIATRSFIEWFSQDYMYNHKFQRELAWKFRYQTIDQLGETGAVYRVLCPDWNIDTMPHIDVVEQIFPLFFYRFVEAVAMPTVWIFGCGLSPYIAIPMGIIRCCLMQPEDSVAYIDFLATRKMFYYYTYIS